MFAVALLFPLSDQQARFCGWTDSIALPDAPKQVACDKITLLDILRMEEADEILRGRVHIRNSRVCKEFRVFSEKKRGFFYLSFYLLDGRGCMCWDRYTLARNASMRYEDIPVAEMHAMYGTVAQNMLVPRNQKSYRFMNLYHWMCRLVNKHCSTIRVLEFTFRVMAYSHFDCCYGTDEPRRIRGYFPRLERFCVNNDIPFTGVTVELLRDMPFVQHVCVHGSLDMTAFDSYYKGEVRPAVEESVAAALPPSLQVLEIDSYHITKKPARIRFATAFAAAAEQGLFARLRKISMRVSFASMRKEEGVVLMNALRHCASLREVVFGTNDRFKKWHDEAIEELVTARGDIRIIRV
jgi:hypothetical protein